ncbi:2-octaprenyl-6-methoxyphenyl hydroxylase [Acidihalobacter prosperus]
MDIEYDVLIVGGGMVGASLGGALAETGYHVGIIEAKPYGTPGQPSYDERSTALALGSKRFLDRFGIWSELTHEAAPISHIHVSERGRFGAVHIDALEQNVQALGYVVPNRAFGAAVLSVLKHAENIDLIAPAEVEQVIQSENEESVEIRFLNNIPTDCLRARLVVAADGTKSPIRQKLGIPVEKHLYGQSALIANVTVGKPCQGWAYERFTPAGPMAMLPMGGDRYSLVWTHQDADLNSTLALSDADFLSALQQRFGWRLGRLKAVGQRAAYPLGLIRSQATSHGRVVLAGNALHTLHPVAGQGFNLALRDVEALSRLLSEGGDPGRESLLQRYRHLREGDMRTVINLTDAMVQLFSERGLLPGMLRSMLFLGADGLPGLNRLLARQHMGLYGAVESSRRLQNAEKFPW